MKSVFLIAIVTVAMIGVMVVPSVFAEISYPTISQRLGELPTYCIVDPVNISTTENKICQHSRKRNTRMG